MNITRITTALAGMVVGAVLVLAAGVVGASQADATEGGGRPAPKFQPCEEGVDVGKCVWDARHMGNGKGRSYKIRWNGEQQFISHRRAHQLAYPGTIGCVR